MKKYKQLKQFYNELCSQGTPRELIVLGAGFTEFIYFILALLWTKEIWHLTGTFILLGYLAPYIYTYYYRIYSKSEKKQSIYDIIKYLPISIRDIRKYQVRMVMRFLAVGGTIIFVTRMLLDIFAYRNVSILTVLTALTIAYIGPFLTNLIVIYVTK